MAQCLLLLVYPLVFLTSMTLGQSCTYPVAVPPGTDPATLHWTEAEAVAEVQRLQTLVDYMDVLLGYDAVVRVINDSKVASAAWVANGCDSYESQLCTGKLAPSPCCKGSTEKYGSCDDQDNVDDGCFFCEQPTNSEYKPERCDPNNFQGASVCGTDSVGNEVSAEPMVSLRSGACSTGPTFTLELEEDNGVTESPIDPEVFYQYANQNWTNVTIGKDPAWAKKVMGYSVVTNAANATERAKVIVASNLGFVATYKPINNGAFSIQGSCTTHFFAFRPTNLATADTYQLIGGNATVIGATNGGSIESNTTGYVRMLNIVNDGGNVASTGGTNAFLGNIESSGNVSVVAGSSVSRLGMYNVTATSGSISATDGVSTLFYVEAKTGVSITINQGNHQIWHSKNHGTISVNNCTAATLYNVTNSGTITAQCNTITAMLIKNSGAITIDAESANINLEFIENSGSVTITGSPASATVKAPSGTTVTAPSGVTVTYTGTTTPASTSGSSSSRDGNNVFFASDTGSGSNALSVICALFALVLSLFF